MGSKLKLSYLDKEHNWCELDIVGTLINNIVIVGVVKSSLFVYLQFLWDLNDENIE